MLVKDYFQRNFLAITCLSTIALLGFLVVDDLLFDFLSPQVSSQTLAVEQKNDTQKTKNKNNTQQVNPQLAKILREPFGQKQIRQLREFLSASHPINVEEIANLISQAGLSNEETINLTLVVLEHWAEFAPALAFTYAHTNPDRGLRRQAVPAILYKLCNESAAIAPCIRELSPGDDLDETLAALAYDIGGASKSRKKTNHSAKTEPRDAIRWANAIQSEYLRKEAVLKIGALWAESYPEDAMAWAVSQDAFQELGITTAKALSESDPWSAAEIASRIDDSNAEFREVIYETIIGVRTDQGDYYTAVSVLDSLPENESPEPYYEAFIEQWSASDPQAAVQNLMNLPESIQRDRLAATALQSWGEQYPHQAVDYASELEAENLRKSAWGAAMNSWVRQDFHSALNWVEQQPPSITLDKAIARVGGNLIHSDVPSESLTALINHIEDDDLRETMVAQIADRGSLAIEETPGE